MATRFVKVLMPTVLRVVEGEHEVSRRVRKGDGPFEIPADDVPGLVNTGRVEIVEVAAPQPTPKQRAKQRAGKTADKAPGKGKGKAAA